MKLAKDVAERAAATYIEAFLGLLLVSNTFASGQIDLSVIQTAAVAAIPAALSVIKSYAATFRGEDTASLVSDV
jgi:hypothetical protein